MGLGPDDASVQVEEWKVVGKSNGKKKKDEGNDDEETTGCWLKFRFMSCLSSPKTKVDGSISGSGTSTLYSNGTTQFIINILFVFLYSSIPFMFIVWLWT